MSEENVEVFRAAFEAWNEGEMDAFGELCHPDIIVGAPPRVGTEPGPFVGREAVMREWQQLRETWDSDTLEPISDFIDAADRVLVRQVWRGVGQGPQSNIELTNVITLRDGKIILCPPCSPPSRRVPGDGKLLKGEVYLDQQQALEAAGLSE